MDQIKDPFFVHLPCHYHSQSPNEKVMWAQTQISYVWAHIHI
jgi:hypothetical protein